MVMWDSLNLIQLGDLLSIDFLWKLRRCLRKRKRVGQQVMFKRKDFAHHIWSCV